MSRAWSPPCSTQVGRAGAKHHRRVHQDPKPVSSFFVLTFLWGCHTESPANSLREVSQVSLQLTAEGRGVPEDRSQFWGWCPLKLKEPLQCGRPEGELPRPYTSVDTSRLPTAIQILGMNVKLKLNLELCQISTQQCEEDTVCPNTNRTDRQV